MKRFLSLLMALAMVLSLLPVAAFADVTTPSITATADKTEADIGNTIEVTFTLTNNPGFNQADMTLTFDQNVLRFTGLKQTENENSGEMEYEGRFSTNTEVNTTVGNAQYGNIQHARNKTTTNDGKLFVALFTVIGAGDTTVGVTVNSLNAVDNDGATTDHAASVTVTASAEITVAGIPATSVTLDKTELSLEEGGNYQLAATVDPADTTDEIVWSSSDQSVATVLNGQVKAVSAGTATITAKANDSASATCAVTVTAEQSIVHKSPDGYSGITATAEMTGVKSLVVGGSTKTIKNIYKLPLTGHEGAWVHMDGAGSGQGAAYKLDGTAVFGVPNGVDLNKFFINIGNVYTPDLLVTEAELTAAVGEDNVSKLGLSEDKLYAFLYIEDPWKNRNSGILFEITPVAATGVEVQETMSLYEGETGNLSVSVLPATNTDGLTVTYSSDSVAVATVDENGKVTAVAPGTAVITVTAGSFTDTCTVTVKSGYVEIENIPGNGDTWKGSVTGITIKDVTVDSYQWNGKTLNVFIAEDTATATAIFNFNKNGYDEKFEETAAITNGSGTLSKTFTYNDGWEGYDITWVVNFMKSVPATSIELNKTTLELTKGSDATLIATLSEGATDTVTWSSSDESVATVDASGKVTAVGGGTATITATAHEGLTATCTVNVPTLYSVQDIPQVPTFKNGKFEITSLEIDANVESATWDGDTLNVVLAEGAAADASISTIWTVNAQNTWFAQDDAHYFFNDRQYGYGTPVTDVHTLVVKLTDGAGTATATFEGRGADCCDDQACDLSFPAKTYTINFTVAEAGGEEPAPTVALPFTLSMDGNPVAVEVQTGKDYCDVYEKDAAILKIKLPAADMEKDMVLSKSADVNMLYINPLCDWQNATQINQYNPDYTFKPSEYAEYLCVENYDAGETYHIVFESEGGSTEPTTYAVNIDSAIVGGTVTASATENIAVGTEITLTAAPNQGYQFVSFDVKKGEETVTVTDGKFVMPEGNVTVSATFTQIPNPIQAVEAKNPLLNKTSAEDATAPVYSVTLMSGVTEDLLLDITVENPDKEATQQLTWSSTKPNVAWVENGKLITGTVTESTAVTLTATVVSEAAAAAIDGESSDALITLNVTVEPANNTQFQVSMDTDKTVDVLGSTDVNVSITHIDTAQVFKAFELVFKYDPALLRLNTKGSETDTRKTSIVDDNGTVTVRSYGAANEGAALTLNFTALTIEDASVELTSAKVGTTLDAQSQDIPDAQIQDSITLIDVSAFTVDLDAAFDGAEVADPSEDYTFTANNNNYVYTAKVTVTKADNTTEEFTLAKGVYTIPKEKITGSIKIEVAAREGKTVTVSFDGDSKAAVNQVTSAQFEVSYVLTAAEGYNLSDYAITYQVGAQGEVKTFDDTYTIPGIEITDNITIVVNADEPGPDTPAIPDTHWGITFEGNAVEDIVKTDGKLPTSVEKNGSFSFTINNADDYTYVVSYKMGEDGDYLDLVNGAYTISPVTNTLVITVNKWKVEVNQYVTLDGKDLFLVAVDETVAEGSGMRYGEDNMYLKSVNDKAEDGKYTGEAHQKYVYLVEVTANETLTVADAAKQLNVMANVNCPEIAVDYNVNGSSTRDINDAQLVYDMYNNVYQNMTTVGIVKFLRADLNGDRTIGVADAATVINDILTNS